nr:hypothetical protein [Mesorhizobium sp.]
MPPRSGALWLSNSSQHYAATPEFFSRAFDLNQRAAFLLVTIFICVLSELETIEVSIDPVNELVQQCIVAQLAGANFPEVWHRILKNHSLVAGPVVQNHANGTPHLEVRLSNGKRLVYREHGYSIE